MRWFAVLLLVVLAACRSGAGDGDQQADRALQVGTISALGAGAYGGVLAVGDLVQHGDLGLGTFDGLDGELVLVDGIVYRVGVDGRPVEADPATTSPFAQVVSFDPDHVLDVPAGTTCDELDGLLDQQIGTHASVLALRFEGTVTSIETRSVPAQAVPYRPLAEVIADDQVMFSLTDVEVVLVGFRTPDALASVSPPGVHLHGVTADRTAGGHVVGCSVASGSLHVDELKRLELLFAP